MIRAFPYGEPERHGMQFPQRFRIVASASLLALLVGGATAPSSWGRNDPNAPDIRTASGKSVTNGSSITSADLPLVAVLRDQTPGDAVKFVVDGTYAGTDTAAPFTLDKPLTSGAHKVRVTVTSPTRTAKQTLRFTLSTSGVNTPNTSMPRATTTTVPVPQTATTLPASTGPVIDVHTVGELQAALASARPGQTIALADGVYDGKAAATKPNESGRFFTSASGTADAPITLTGTRNAILDGAGPSGGYVLHLNNANYWHLTGFTARAGSKGIVLDDSDHVVIEGVRVTEIGQEAVHFRNNSSDNIIRNSQVDTTGLTSPQFGEGVYIGSAKSNWSTYSGGQPDRSDRNKVIDNHIYDVTAENIDIKEGSSGGEIRGNQLGGNRIASKNSADSWIDIKGNDYLVTANRGSTSARPGTTTCGDPSSAGADANPFCDGIQIHELLSGWGIGNRVSGNELDVNAPGVGVWVQSSLVAANIVGCDNVVRGAAAGSFATGHYGGISCAS